MAIIITYTVKSMEHFHILRTQVHTVKLTMSEYMSESESESTFSGTLNFGVHKYRNVWLTLSNLVLLKLSLMFSLKTTVISPSVPHILPSCLGET